MESDRHWPSEQTFYGWRQRYGVLKADEGQRLNARQAENAWLKRIEAMRSTRQTVMPTTRSF